MCWPWMESGRREYMHIRGGGSQIKIKTERNKSVLNHTKKNKNKSRLQTLQNTENTLGLNKSEKGIIK